MPFPDRRSLAAGKIRMDYCEERAANCERLAAAHPDIYARRELLRIAEAWRRWSHGAPH
jgi:hypothetical protein